MRDLVVLHGAWHQPAHLDVVAESLRQRGVADRAVALLRPEPASTFTEAAPRAAYREIPSSYVACSQDRAILPEMVDPLAQRCSEQVTWPTSRSPHLSRPDDVVDLALAHL